MNLKKSLLLTLSTLTMTALALSACSGDGEGDVPGPGEAPYDTPELKTDLPFCVTLNGCGAGVRPANGGTLNISVLASGKAFGTDDTGPVSTTTQAFSLSGEADLAESDTYCGAVDLTFSEGEQAAAFTPSSFDTETLSLSLVPTFDGQMERTFKGELLTYVGAEITRAASEADSWKWYCYEHYDHERGGANANSNVYQDHCQSTCKQVKTDHICYDYDIIGNRTGSYSCPTFETQCSSKYGKRTAAYYNQKDGKQIAVDVENGEIVYEVWESDGRIYHVGTGQFTGTFALNPTDIQVGSTGAMRLTFDCAQPEGGESGASVPAELAAKIFAAKAPEGEAQKDPESLPEL